MWNHPSPARCSPNPALSQLCWTTFWEKFGQPSSGAAEGQSPASFCLQLFCCSECQEGTSVGEGKHGITPSTEGMHDKHKPIGWGAGGIVGRYLDPCKEMCSLPLLKANKTGPLPRISFMKMLSAQPWNPRSRALWLRANELY